MSAHRDRGDWSADKSASLRIHLARVGIVLDEPKRTAAKAEPVAYEPAPIGREAIELELRANGAPERDIAWLVASCPSMADAENFRPYVILY